MQYGLQGKVMRSFQYGKGSLFVIDAESNNVYIGFGSGLIGRASVKDLDTIEIGEAHMYAVYDLKVDLEIKVLFIPHRMITKLCIGMTKKKLKTHSYY